MTHDQLTGKYARLRNELDAAYAEPTWTLGRSGRIDRLANEIAEVERTLAVQRIGARLINVDETPVAQARSSHLSMV